MTNIEIIKQIYHDYATQNMTDLMAKLDNNITWIEPGAPAVPFGGTFVGKEGIMSMFAKQAQLIKVKTFDPKIFFSNDTQVAVIGSDSAEVIKTGKVYSTDWTQLFTFKDGLIVHVQVHMDTNAIANAFLP